VDHSDVAERVIDAARKLASLSDGEVWVLHLREMETMSRAGFTTGPHIALMEQFEGAIGLYPRQQLRLILKHKLGVELNP
jgi:hypothetical protein